MIIPSQAKRVFKGIIYDVYHWEQEMFDGTFETFEALKRPNTLQVIVTQGDKILISEEEQPTKEAFFTMFGGRQEEGETSLEGVKRELLEESGLVSEDWDLLRTYSPTHKIEWDIKVYVARNCQKVREPKLDAGEKIVIKEYSFEDFLDMVNSDKFRGREFAYDMCKLRLDPDKLKEFRTFLFKP